jgi:putative PIN family toxin of toxin-antitoxin system
VPETKVRVFLDSNVVFSGLYSARGAPGVILEYFIQGRIRVIISQQGLQEIVRTIKEKLPAALPALKYLLLNAPPEVVADPKPEALELWRKKLSIGDAAILAAAIASQPDYFITGDNHFLGNPELAKESGLRIVTPGQFLKLWEQNRIL